MSPDEFASRRALRRAVEITQPDAELRSWELEDLQALYALKRATSSSGRPPATCGGS